MVYLYPIRNLEKMQAEDVAKAKKLRERRFDWRYKKLGAFRLSRLFEVAAEEYHDSTWKQYAIRAAGCGKRPQFQKWIDTGDKRLQGALFCKLRLCPMCTARRARKNALKLSQVMNEVQVKNGVEFLFLTLTVDSCDGNQLGNTLGLLTQAWARLLDQRPVKKACKGWYRAIEITHGECGYHPHIHAILAVNSDYGSKRKGGQYITQAEWARRWQMALKVTYKPIVHIQKTKDKKGGMGAVLEASKYATKDSEYIRPDLDEREGAKLVVDYTTALRGRRLIAFGGCMKEAAARLGADKEDGDLIHLGDEVVRDDVADLIETYDWHFGAGDYILIDSMVNPLKVMRKNE